MHRQYGTPRQATSTLPVSAHVLAPDPGRPHGHGAGTGALSSQRGGEEDIRKSIINADLVDCIVAMPTHLFYTTPIPVSLGFLVKNKKQKWKPLFIDTRKMGTLVTRKLRELTDEDTQKLADTCNAFVDDTLEKVMGFCAVATTEEIAKQDYILTLDGM